MLARYARGARLAGCATLLGALLGLAPGPTPAGAQVNCTFQLGFRVIRDLIPAQVGQCVENEWHNPANGDTIQHTTGGMLVWRKADNWTAFTDGYNTWVNGPNGLQRRLNSQRFAWEDGGTAAGPSTAADSLLPLVAQLHELNRQRVAMLAEIVAQLDGRAHVIGGDGTYLGKVTSNLADPESIANPIGTYGSTISPSSIHNEIGRYGSTISTYSAYDTIAFEPPRIVIGSARVGYLTKNSIKVPNYDPDELLALLGRGEFATVLLTDGEAAVMMRLDGSRFALRASGCRLSAGNFVVLIDGTLRKSDGDRRCSFRRT